MIVALNNLDIKSGDIISMYVQAPVEKRCGPLWVLSSAKIPERLQIIVRALYSLKSTGATFRSHLARFMKSISMSVVRPTKIYDQNEKPGQKMGYNIIHTYDIMWITFFVSTKMQMVCFSDYIGPFHLSQDLRIQTHTWVQSCARPGYIM